jgi:hypothetical protein
VGESNAQASSRPRRVSNPRAVPMANPPCAAPTGLEPATPGLTGRCSDQLSYDTMCCVPGARFERALTAVWTPRLYRWATRAWWTTSVSNRAGAACKAALHTCASPMEPAAGLEPAPRAYETRAPPVVLRWREGRRRESNSPSPTYKVGAPPVAPRRRTLGRIRTGTGRPLRPLPLPLGYEGSSWERRIRTSTVPLQRRASCQLDQLPSGWPAGRGSRRPSAPGDRGQRGPRRGRRLDLQHHARLGGTAVALALVAAVAGDGVGSAVPSAVRAWQGVVHGRRRAGAVAPAAGPSRAGGTRPARCCTTASSPPSGRAAPRSASGRRRSAGRAGPSWISATRADPHPHRVAETDPVERAEVGVDDQHGFHRILPSFVAAGGWSGWPGSNRRASPWQGDALPAALQPRESLRPGSNPLLPSYQDEARPVGRRHGAASGSRTRTDRVLRPAPLPLGYRGTKLRGQELNLRTPDPKSGCPASRAPRNGADRGDRTRVFGLEDRREHQPHQVRMIA